MFICGEIRHKSPNFAKNEDFAVFSRFWRMLLTGNHQKLHRDAAEILDGLAKELGAEQIIVGRVGARGLKERVFGGVTGRLVASASVPVTIIP